MTSQPGYYTVIIHSYYTVIQLRGILPNISRNKNSCTIKFGQLIEYN